MRVARLISVYWTFYRTNALSSLLLSVIGLVLIWFGKDGFIGLIFLLKLLCFALLFLFTEFIIPSKQRYYFQNLGLSTSRLWLICILTDLSVFMLLLYLIKNLQ